MHEYEWFKKRIGTTIKVTFPSKETKEIKVKNAYYAAWLNESQSLGYEYEDKQNNYNVCIACEG